MQGILWPGLELEILPYPIAKPQLQIPMLVNRRLRKVKQNTYIVEKQVRQYSICSKQHEQ